MSNNLLDVSMGAFLLFGIVSVSNPSFRYFLPIWVIFCLFYTFVSARRLKMDIAKWLFIVAAGFGSGLLLRYIYDQAYDPVLALFTGFVGLGLFFAAKRKEESLKK